MADLDARSGLLNRSGLGALVDTSGGDDDGFVQSPVNSVANAWVYYGPVATTAHYMAVCSQNKDLCVNASKLF